MLTTFRLVNDDMNVQNNLEGNDSRNEYWHVLNCHLQAGKQGGRRVRQIVEGEMTRQYLCQHLAYADKSIIIV